MQVIALLLAAGLLAAAQFCVRPARTYRSWWVALVATELSHVGVLLALGLVGWAVIMQPQAGTLAWGWLGVAGMALTAAALFARPAWSAWRLSRRVEKDVTTAFGAEGLRFEKLWSWQRLGRWPTSGVRANVETFVLETGATALPIDFYPALRSAAGTAATSVCVVLVHGGGWDSGDRTELAGFNHWLAARGVAVVAVSYRLAPAHRWPAQRDDVRAAIDWVRANAPRLGINADRLVLLGRSAGAQIAVATAYGQALPGVKAVVALYGCYDLEFVWSIRSATDSLNSDKLLKQFLGGGPDNEAAAEVYRSGSAEKLVHAEVPPTLLIHGALDQLVWCRHSERLAAALSGAGARHAFVRLPWATHAAEANLHGPAGQLITGTVLRVALAVAHADMPPDLAPPSS